MLIEAVLFDLDDTLFDQADWLNGAWRAVARAAASSYGLDEDSFLDALLAVAARGSDKGGIIDQALTRTGHGGVPVAPLVEVFHGHRPRRLSPYPGTAAALARLRQRLLIGVVTDGRPDTQRSKLESLGLQATFDVVVVSDEMGRAYRKPNPAAFERATRLLGVPAERTVHVGDRPDKDVAGAVAAGVRAIRVRTGEYRSRPSFPVPWATVDDVVSAIRLLETVAPASWGNAERNVRIDLIG